MSDFADSLAEFNAQKSEHHRGLMTASIEFLLVRGKMHSVAFALASVEGQPSERGIGLDILRAGILEAPVVLADRGGPLRVGSTFVVCTARDVLLVGTKWQVHKIDHAPLEPVVKATCQRIEEGQS